MLSYPTAPKRPYEITQHGYTRIDNYYWMRDRSDPEVLKYLHAENDYLEEIMGHTKSLQETLYSEMKGRLKETDSTVPEKRGDYFYYSRTEEGKQYPIYCRKKGSLDSPEEILLDQNELFRRRALGSSGKSGIGRGSSRRSTFFCKWRIGVPRARRGPVATG